MRATEKMRLCVATISGDKQAKAQLEALKGGPITTLAEVDAIMRDAFDAMTPSERAQDEKCTLFDLDSIASGRGRA